MIRRKTTPRKTPKSTQSVAANSEVNSFSLVSILGSKSEKIAAASIMPAELPSIQSSALSESL